MRPQIGDKTVAIRIRAGDAVIEDQRVHGTGAAGGIIEVVAKGEGGFLMREGEFAPAKPACASARMTAEKFSGATGSGR